MNTFPNSTNVPNQVPTIIEELAIDESPSTKSLGYQLEAQRLIETIAYKSAEKDNFTQEADYYWHLAEQEFQANYQ